MKILRITLIVTMITMCFARSLTILSPKELTKIVDDYKNKTKSAGFHMSPIGYRPLSGVLQGKVAIADPIGACSPIQDLHSYQQDLFVMADDSQCLQSVKAKNIAASGGFLGLIRLNINNTLHDKQVNLVHVPIIELEPALFDQIKKFQEDNPKNKVISMAIDFTDDSQTHESNLQIWFSPTEIESYKTMLDLKPFIQQLEHRVSFSPHYILQSQAEQKVYIGCYSKGKYCPTEIEYQGKYQGMNIVEETLRQIVVKNQGLNKWWKYIQNFYKTCLLTHSQTIFLNSSLLSVCSENSLIMSGINIAQFKDQFRNTFLGQQIKQHDDNFYLRQERQLYTRQQITFHPAAIVNKNVVPFHPQMIKTVICNQQSSPKEGSCMSSKSVSNKEIFIFVLIMFIIFVVLAGMYRLYIQMKMKTQIKTEVDKTLQQYYRYIETFEGNNGEIADLNKKRNSNQKSRPLTQQFEEVTQKRREISIEMRQSPTK